MKNKIEKMRSMVCNLYINKVVKLKTHTKRKKKEEKRKIQEVQHPPNRRFPKTNKQTTAQGRNKTTKEIKQVLKTKDSRDTNFQIERVQ